MEKGQIIRKIAAKFGAFNVFVILFFVFALGMMPHLLNYDAYFVASHSMEPTIKKGSLIFIEHIDFEDIEVGDILCFDTGGKNGSFTHRVISIVEEKKAFVTKGDFNEINDPAISYYRDVKGIMKYEIPFIGYISMMVSSRAGVAAIIVAFIIWISIEIEFFRLKGKGAEVS